MTTFSEAARPADAVAPVAGRWPTWAAYGYAVILAATFGYFLYGIPIQLTDCYGNMLKLVTPWRELIVGEFSQRSYLRPFLFAELKVVYDLSGGNFTPWFRGVHVAQVAALALLYVHLVRPRTWTDAAAVVLGLAVLTGIHTFIGTVVEAFPVNTFLTIVLCCFAAAALSLARHRWWTDVLAVLLFIVAALTVESGLLVWVIFIGGALVGARGVSRPALGVLILALAGYFILRFGVFHVGSPGLIERSSGYGFHVLDPDELQRKFGANPLAFYAYNVLTSAVSVVFSEPRGGVFRLVWGLTHQPEPSMIVNFVASTTATLVICAYAWQRRLAWLGRRFDHQDRLVLLFVMVLAANAIISYPYTKDVIMSPAGAFFALAVYAAVRHLIAAVEVSPSLVRSAATTACCAVLAATWGIREVGIHMNLRSTASKVRTEWAYADSWLEQQNIDMSDPHARALFEQLRDEATIRHPSPPRWPIIDNEWLDID